MATYYNKELIDGISELPRMTKAEFDELSLDEKPINWICRNYTGTQRGIKSSDIEHGTGTVADALTPISITPTINTTYIDNTSINTIFEVNQIGKLVIINISGLALKSALSGSPVLLSNLPKPKNILNASLTNFLSGGSSADGWNTSRYHINASGELQLWYDSVPQNSIPFGLIIYVAE